MAGTGGAPSTSASTQSTTTDPVDPVDPVDPEPTPDPPTDPQPPDPEVEPEPPTDPPTTLPTDCDICSHPTSLHYASGLPGSPGYSCQATVYVHGANEYSYPCPCVALFPTPE